MSPFAIDAKAHLKEYRPKQYRALEENGSLDEYVRRLGSQAESVLNDALEQGLAHDQALELARPFYLFPEEAEIPDLTRNPYAR